MSLVLKINALELVARLSLYYDKNKCARPSTCYKTLLAFQIRLRDMIHNSLCLILMETWSTSSAVQSSAVFTTLWHVTVRRVISNRIIRAFKEPHFSESITPEILKLWKWSFFTKCSKFCLSLKNAIITQENSFSFEDKSFGSFGIMTRIHMSSHQPVKRRSQHFRSDQETWYTTHFVWY